MKRAWSVDDDPEAAELMPHQRGDTEGHRLAVKKLHDGIIGWRWECSCGQVGMGRHPSSGAARRSGLDHIPTSPYWGMDRAPLVLATLLVYRWHTYRLDADGLHVWIRHTADEGGVTYLHVALDALSTTTVDVMSDRWLG